MGRLFIILARILSTLSVTIALQVTPNSPCASHCMDTIDLDRSDPRSSSTLGNDIVCQNADYISTSQGKKFQECMECLQLSDYSQGSENDQMWFLCKFVVWCVCCLLFVYENSTNPSDLDNLRYAFDYCILGYPNATGVDIGPCATSVACGVLQPGLTVDKLDPTKVKPYEYCNSEITGDFYDQCLDCVAADRTKTYLANCKAL